MILSFDTSSALTSVAATDGERVLAQREELDARRHAEVLAPMLAEVLDDAGLEPADVHALACGVGPGPYTGLRVGIATARALGLAWDVPAYGLCSLDAMATAAFASTSLDRLCVAVDARRREVYWAAYSRTDGRTAGPMVMRPADIDPAHRDLPWVGPEDHASDLEVEVVAHPHAAWVGRAVAILLENGEQPWSPSLELAEHGADGHATAAALVGHALLAPEPLYLRRPDAAVPVVRA